MDVPKSLDVLTEPFDAVTRSVCRSKSLFDQYLHQPDVSKTSIDRRGTSSWVAPDTQAIAGNSVSQVNASGRKHNTGTYLKVTTICVCVLCTQWSGT